ncbi:MAG: hypothetical protein A2091_02275 [Desulfuromonadales bacterium GWD2_61_12]|nr:MAG: hypothetical protein A2005_04185 [Desulfuromonadales bacterium GWC2_61_20]OGR34132.1 MAG: hypothetical protein A2091_02275 [Desulfuromonadales bacterium GWD2_61_12]HAD04532.1 hypothetical protein [Desulfuromonas sp.]HBT83444.1 hypothetical protein [Desulfuromonas sp.]
MDTTERTLVSPLQSTLEQIQSFLPQLLAALFIVACGFFVGWLFKVVVRRMLLWLKFDAGCGRLGLSELLGRNGNGEMPSTMVARLCGGLVVLVFVVLAINSLNINVLQHLIERFLAYLPNVLVAGLVMLAALYLGSFVGRAVLIACVNAGNRLARLCARSAHALVLALGGVMALEQLGIGKDAVLLAFAIAFGGVVLALALAFGLGGRELARDFLEKKLRPAAEEDELKHL